MGSIRGVTSLNLGTGSATVTIALPAGTVVGDVLVVIQGSAWAIASSVVPPGWTFADLIVGSDCNGAAFYRPATADIVTAGSISYVNDNPGAGIAHLYALTGFYPVSAKWSVRVTNGGNSTSAAFAQVPANLYLYAATQKIATPLPTISRGTAQGTPFTGPAFVGLTKSETGVTAAGQTVAFGHSTGGFAASYDVVLETVPAAVGFTNASLSAFTGTTTSKVTWPIINDGVLSYDVRADGGASTNIPAAGVYTFTGLSAGASHTLQVREVYAGGPGPYASITVRTPAVVYVLDDFARADSTSALGTPYEGGPYTVRTGTFGISSAQGYAAASLLNSHATFPAAVDVDIQATIPVQPTTTGGVGVIVRWVDASNYWLLSNSSSGSSSWILVHNAAGTLTQFGPNGPAAAAGDVIRLVAVGRNLYCLVNGKLVIWWEDQFFSAATAVAGIRISSSIVYRIDNLSAVPGVLPGDGATALLYKGRDTAALDAGSVA